LEKQLRLNKRKSKGLPTSFKEDGLDYILGACDSKMLAEFGGGEDSDEVKITMKYFLFFNFHLVF